MAEQVLVTEAGKVLHLRLNRPEKKNALTRDMYRTLVDALDRADADPAIRAVTISGAGDAFTAGNDLADFLAGGPVDETSPQLRLLRALVRARKPLVAAVNGVAVGIGVTMLLHCDLVYAAEEATFQLNFVNIGLVPEAGSSLLLPRMVGHHRAAELLLLGDMFDAATAHRMGIVNAVCPKDALAAKLDQVAAALAAKPPASLRITKQLLKGAGYETELIARQDEELVHFGRQLVSPEAREAMTAFMEKRKPDFSKFT